MTRPAPAAIWYASAGAGPPRKTQPKPGCGSRPHGTTNPSIVEIRRRRAPMPASRRTLDAAPSAPTSSRARSWTAPASRATVTPTWSGALASSATTRAPCHTATCDRRAIVPRRVVAMAPCSIAKPAGRIPTTGAYGSRCACPSASTAKPRTGAPPTASSAPSSPSSARSVVPGGWISSPASRLLPSRPGSITSVESPRPSRPAATAAPAMPPPAMTTSNARASLTSIHPRHDPPPDLTAIRVPVRAVFRPADVVVAALAVDEQEDHVGEVEVRQGVLEPRGQTPGEGHDEVAEVVQMAREAPPAGGQQQRADGGADELRRPSPHRPRRIAAEPMLLDVRGAEDGVARHVQGDDARRRRRQRVRVVHEVVGLNGVRERHPDEVAPREHPAEFLVLDVPRGEDRLLVEEIVGDVEELERVDEQHRRRHRAVPLVLRGRERQIEEDPEDQAGAALAEILEVEAAEARVRSEEHTSELQSQSNLVCRLLLEKKKKETKLQSRHRRHDHSRTTQSCCVEIGTQHRRFYTPAPHQSLRQSLRARDLRIMQSRTRTNPS